MTDPTVHKAEIARRLKATRSVTLRLLYRVPDAFWNVRVHDFYSPIGWHFGHVGMTEEFWTHHRALDRSPADEALYFLFANLPENSKDNRAAHLPSRAQVIAYLEQTRRRSLAALEDADLSGSDRLLSGGYAWEFARLHECQHQETIAELLQLIAGAPELTEEQDRPQPIHDATERCPPPGRRLLIPGGTFQMGSDDPLLAYDNEQPAHPVTVAPFCLDRSPVTNSEWLRFLQDGGYRRPEFWHPDGWAWRCVENIDRPEYWRPAGKHGEFCLVGPQGFYDLDPLLSVHGISWYEADAYARWAGKRLPTEAEWEFAAAYDPATGRSRRYPWGEEAPTLAHADFGRPGEIPARDHQEGHVGASAFGIEQMAGGVWEWTASPFVPYPGFEAFPYDGYSKDHMDGQHQVCKGGSWASAADIIRCAFRNWYVPTYRQGFLGVRCAAEAE